MAKYKADADNMANLQKELDELKKSGGDDYKKKYEDEKKAFEDYKTSMSAEKTKAAKENAFREILKAEKISEKRIGAVMKASVGVIDNIELDESGNVKDREKISANIKEEWGDFIVTEENRGAEFGNPPEGSGDPLDLGKLSMDEYIRERKKK